MTIFTQTMRSASTKMQALELFNQSISKLIAQVLLAVSLLIGMVGFSLTTHGQCSFTALYGSAEAPAAGETVNFPTCMFAGEYNIMTGAAESKIYTVLSTNGNDYVTVRQGSPSGTIIGSGAVPFTFTSTVAGMYFFHISADSSCSIENACRNTSVSLAAAGCTSIDACNYDPFAITDDGSCLTFIDCAGICGGTSILDACGNCYIPLAAGEENQTLTFNYTGSVQTWVVPNGVNEVNVELFGAQGGANGIGFLGGEGGFAAGSLSVSEGQTLYIYTGGSGVNGGWNGGGICASPWEGGKGGGEIICKGTPEEIVKNKKSFTAQFLKKELL
jgi:hypothetical protein